MQRNHRCTGSFRCNRRYNVFFRLVLFLTKAGKLLYAFYDLMKSRYCDFPCFYVDFSFSVLNFIFFRIYFHAADNSYSNYRQHELIDLKLIYAVIKKKHYRSSKRCITCPYREQSISFFVSGTKNRPEPRWFGPDGLSFYRDSSGIRNDPDRYGVCPSWD